MTQDYFTNHPVFEKLEQLKTRLSDKETKEKIDIDKLTFYESAYNYISSRLSLTIPSLVLEGELNSLASEVEAGLSHINSFLGSNNIGYLSNADNSFHSALNRVRNLPLPITKGDFNFAKSLANFQALARDKYELLEEKNKELEQNFEKLTGELKKKDDEFNRISKLLEQKENEIQNLNSAFQTDFINIKSKAVQDFDTDRKTFRNEIDTDKKLYRDEIDLQKKTIDTDTTSIIESLNTKLVEAKKLVNIIGNVGVTGNYQQIADSHKKAADWLRIAAILLMIILSGLLIYTIWNISGVNFDWQKALVRIIAVAILTYPATYAAKESNKHRVLENYNRKAELELASINPFIEILSDEKKEIIKERLVDKYFGNNIDNLHNEKNNSEDIPISVLERLSKLAPFASK